MGEEVLHDTPTNLHQSCSRGLGASFVQHSRVQWFEDRRNKSIEGLKDEDPRKQNENGVGDARSRNSCSRW